MRRDAEGRRQSDSEEEERPREPVDPTAAEPLEDGESPDDPASPLRRSGRGPHPTRDASGEPVRWSQGVDEAGAPRGGDD